MFAILETATTFAWKTKQTEVFDEVNRKNIAGKIYRKFSSSSSNKKKKKKILELVWSPRLDFGILNIHLETELICVSYRSIIFQSNSNFHIQI